MTLPYHTLLNKAQQQEAGLPSIWPLAIADRVRFAELDSLNHVNNAAYMTWFETARINYFAMTGLSTYQQGDPRLVVRRVELDYLKEMLMGEDYIVTARTSAVRTTSFTLENELWSLGVLRATYRCVIVLLNPDGSGRMPIPQNIRAEMLSTDQAIDETI